jgi:hypothetical protein
MRRYLKGKINELGTHSKNRITRDWCIRRNEFKTRANLVKDEEVDQCSESHSVLNRVRNHFCQLLNV